MPGLSEREVASLLLNAFLCGICLGGIYDLFRAVKMLFGVSYSDGKAENERSTAFIWSFFVTFICDVVFWLFAGVVSIILIYAAGGFFRGSAYFGMVVGFLFYYFTLGRAVLALNKIVTAFLHRKFYKLAMFFRRRSSAMTRAIISLFPLTIGRIFDKIKDSTKSQEVNEREGEIEANKASESERGKEGFVDVERGKGYRREGRVSFGKRE